MKKVILSLLIIVSSLFLNAQNFGLGASAMYNFQTESFGFGARANFFPNSTISFVPQFTYYPGIGEISEYIIGLGIEYKIRRGSTLTYYLLGHGGYNKWSDYDESAMKGAEPTNWNAEAGIGVTTNKCLRPFLEYRYNFKFQETHLRVGLLYVFGCIGGPQTGGRRGAGKICPAYN
jgi:hypothetical protein